MNPGNTGIASASGNLCKHFCPRPKNTNGKLKALNTHAMCAGLNSTDVRSLARVAPKLLLVLVLINELESI